MLLAVLPAQAQQAAAPAGANTATAAKPAAKPAARQASSGDEALDNAVAAVVVAALAEQMDTQSIEVNIDSFEVRISSVRDRVVSGLGRMRIGDDADWIGFRYSTIYDTTFASAGYPQLTIGGVSAGEREVPNDATLVRQLEDKVAAELDRQFGDRASRLQLDHISTVEGGKRLLRISASGIADFGINGSTPIRIEALFDQVANAWQRVNYELGAAAAR
ncbi:MAG: hypothetical protein KIS72_09650 [Luteimonas sp.]|nr:hypothetical protein [Luteimonas sp.]